MVSFTYVLLIRVAYVPCLSNYLSKLLCTHAPASVSWWRGLGQNLCRSPAISFHSSRQSCHMSLCCGGTDRIQLVLVLQRNKIYIKKLKVKLYKTL